MNYKEQYLTFEILSNGNINWCSNNNSSIHNTVEYSKNEGEWTSITASQSGVNIPVVSGDVLRFRGDNATYSNTMNRFGMFGDGKTTAQFNVSGNIMSLINSTNFSELKDFTGTYNFRALFNECRTLISAENLILPATGLTTGCYRFLFQNCTNLTKGPQILATTLVSESCYQMFYNCRNLNYIFSLATSGINSNNSIYNWVSGVSSTGTFVKAESATWPTGNYGIPTNWTVEYYNPFGPDTDELSFNANSGSETITFESESAWTATTQNSWITLSKYSGETGGEITVSVSYNQFNSRTGSVVFTDGENTATLTVIQGVNTLVPIMKLYRGDRRIN